jgi:hypothetical protein
MRITDKSFCLPRIIAESIEYEMTETANTPYIILGLDSQTLMKNEYVLKPIGAKRMSTTASMRELLASFISLELEIPTPNPVIVEVNNLFVQSCFRNEEDQTLTNSVGDNFGTEFLPSTIEFSPLIIDSYGNLLTELQSIYVFDMFIENSDRTFTKPNMLISQRIINIIDHEIAFGFSMDFSPNPTVWELNGPTAYNHCLFPYLKGKKFIATNIFDNLLILNNHFWQKAETLMPISWMDDTFIKIRDRLLSKVQYIQEFKKEIIGTLK